jgi:adenylylsulfate kinase-like enzyme
VVTEDLRKRGIGIERFDGDNIRKSLTKDLGLTEEDRNQNIERVTFITKLTRNGVTALTSFLSTYNSIHAYSRKEIGD